MSAGGFHVHGPHDHELENSVKDSRSAHDSRTQTGRHHGIGGGSMTNQIALFTAIVATVGAIFSYMGGATQASAGLYKNNAVIKKTEAANQWSYFQAKSTKQSMAELSRDLAPEERKASFQATIDRYEKEKNVIKLEAEKFDNDAAEWNTRSDTQMYEHHRWAQATTALQITIALAAIALLTRKRWLEYGMFAVGSFGVFIGCLAMLHI